MIKERLYPHNIEELKAIVSQYSQDTDSIACQAGHFLVYYDHTEDLLLPGIAEELNGPRHKLIADEIGHYPLLTWQVALSSLASSGSFRKKIIIVVNDWQYLPKEVDRLDFYRQHSCLPISYQKALDAYQSVELLSPERKPNLNTGAYFSEQTLRNNYERHVKELIQVGGLPSHASVEFAQDITCNLLDSLGQKREIYCSGKRQNCTHEVAELVWAVFDQAKPDIFVNFFPLVCKEYMLEGTELSHELFGHSIQKVINIGMKSSHVYNENDLFAGAEVAIHDFNI